MWRAVTACLWEDEALVLMQTSRAALAAVGPAVQTLRVQVCGDGKGEEPEALLQLLGRVPNITRLEAAAFCSLEGASETRQLALLQALLGGGGGRRLWCVRHDVILPSPASAELMRRAYGSALLPELEELCVELALADEVEGKMEDEVFGDLIMDVGELVADVVEARRGLGLPGLKELGDIHRVADDHSLGCIYRACFTTLREFDCGGPSRVGMLAELFRGHANGGGWPIAPIGLERLRLRDWREDTEPAALDAPTQCIAHVLGLRTAPRLVTIELHGMRGYRWPKVLGQALLEGALPQLRELSLAWCGIALTDYTADQMIQAIQLCADIREWSVGMVYLIIGLYRTPLLRLLDLTLTPTFAIGELLSLLAGVLRGGACPALETLAFNYKLKRWTEPRRSPWLWPPRLARRPSAASGSTS